MKELIDFRDFKYKIYSLDILTKIYLDNCKKTGK